MSLTGSEQQNPKPIWKPTMLDWIRYSGASMSVTVNPFHWSLFPRFGEPKDVWTGPNERRFVVSWLFFTIRAWIDDGSW